MSEHGVHNDHLVRASKLAAGWLYRRNIRGEK